MTREAGPAERERARVSQDLAEARTQCEVLERELARAVADRDAAIRHAVAVGFSRREVSALVGLSVAGVQQVVRRELRRPNEAQTKPSGETTHTAAKGR
jgi:hypothetical protein